MCRIVLWHSMTSTAPGVHQTSRSERGASSAAQMARAEGVTEELKATDQMKWVGMMNGIRQAAEETVLTELVYN